MKSVRSQSGSILVEAAIGLPLIFLLCFGILKFSIALTQNGLYSDGLKVAARSGVGKPLQLCSDIHQAVSEAAIQYMDQFGLERDGNPIVSEAPDDIFQEATEPGGAAHAHHVRRVHIRLRARLAGILPVEYQLEFPLESTCS